MALGMMSGAGGSWEEDEQKKKRKISTLADGVYGTDDKARGLAQQAAPANRPENAALGILRTPTSEPKRYPISQAAKDKMSGQLTDMGINTANPYVTGVQKPKPVNQPSFFTGIKESTDELITETYADNNATSTVQPPRIGFDPVNNPQAIKSNVNFRMPNTPRRTAAEQQERQTLLRDASTAHKGAQNGQLTANQMQLRAGLVSADDKYKNDQYGAQLSAVSQLAQAQLSQEGANQRAVLGEANTNARLNSQLGFDAGKFQQTAAAEQQRAALDARRLDMEQANNDVANFAPKQLNALHEKYNAAQNDEDRSAIAKQIQALKGVAEKRSRPVVITQTGESPLPGDLGGVKKNPSIIYDPDTGGFTELPKKEINFSDPEVLAIINNRDLSDEEMQSQIAALYS